MTILEMLLDKLPENYVDAVINNMERPSEIQDEAICFEIDFLSLFDWEDSREGYDFWEEVLESVIEGNELPSFPIVIEYAPSTYIVADDLIYLMNSANTNINLCFTLKGNPLSTFHDKGLEKYLSFVN